MATLSSIRKQIAALEKKAQDLIKKESAGAVAKAREIIAKFGLTAEDLGLSGDASRKPRTPAATRREKKASRQKTAGTPMYRDPASQKTWTGRGKPPAWIAGVADRTPFLISTRDAPATALNAPRAAKKATKVAADSSDTGPVAEQGTTKPARKASDRKRSAKDAAPGKSSAPQSAKRPAGRKVAGRKATRSKRASPEATVPAET
jgi:DNA-binding protein H-NS